MFAHTATRGDVFWQPILYALSAWIVFGLVGLGLGGVNGAIALGGLMGSLAWTIGFVTWLSILRESYAAESGQLSAVSGQPEQEPDEPDQGVERLAAWSGDGMRQIILRPPCTASQLHQFCLGMVRERPTTFQYWVIEAKEFTQAQFTSFREWMMRSGFARMVDGNRLELTAEGLEMCEWVFERGVQKV